MPRTLGHWWFKLRLRGPGLECRAPWGKGWGCVCYPLTSRRQLQWYRCWTKVASRAGHPVLRDWAFDESNLSSATASGLLVGLREKWIKHPQQHTSPSGHQRLFLLSSSHPERKNKVQTQTIRHR